MVSIVLVSYAWTTWTVLIKTPEPKMKDTNTVVRRLMKKGISRYFGAAPDEEEIKMRYPVVVR
jgi:hypothetical protein